MSTRGKRITGWHLRGAIGALSLIVVGWLLGMVTDRFVVAREPVDETAAARAHRAAMVSFREELGLTAEEAAEIHEILIRRQDEVDAIWRELRERLHDEIQVVHDEIRALLTPEQQARFEEWLRRNVTEGAAGDPALRWIH